MVRRRTALGGDGGGSQGTVDDSDGGDGSQQLTGEERAIFGEVDDGGGGGTTDTTTTDTTTTTTADPFAGPRRRAFEQTPEPEPEPDPTPSPEPTTGGVGTPRERAVEQTPEPAPEPEPTPSPTPTEDPLSGRPTGETIQETERQAPEEPTGATGGQGPGSPEQVDRITDPTGRSGTPEPPGEVMTTQELEERGLSFTEQFNIAERTAEQTPGLGQEDVRFREAGGQIRVGRAPLGELQFQPQVGEGPQPTEQPETFAPRGVTAAKTATTGAGIGLTPVGEQEAGAAQDLESAYNLSLRETFGRAMDEEFQAGEEFTVERQGGQFVPQLTAEGERTLREFQRREAAADVEAAYNRQLRETFGRTEVIEEFDVGDELRLQRTEGGGFTTALTGAGQEQLEGLQRSFATDRVEEQINERFRVGFEVGDEIALERGPEGEFQAEFTPLGQRRLVATELTRPQSEREIDAPDVRQIENLDTLEFDEAGQLERVQPERGAFQAVFGAPGELERTVRGGTADVLGSAGAAVSPVVDPIAGGAATVATDIEQSAPGQWALGPPGVVEEVIQAEGRQTAAGLDMLGRGIGENVLRPAGSAAGGAFDWAIETGGAVAGAPDELTDPLGQYGAGAIEEAVALPATAAQAPEDIIEAGDLGFQGAQFAAQELAEEGVPEGVMTVGAAAGTVGATAGVATTGRAIREPGRTATLAGAETIAGTFALSRLEGASASLRAGAAGVRGQTIDIADLTTERVVQGLRAGDGGIVPEFVTSPSAPTGQAVSEVAERAADQPQALRNVFTESFGIAGATRFAGVSRATDVAGRIPRPVTSRIPDPDLPTGGGRIRSGLAAGDEALQRATARGEALGRVAGEPVGRGIGRVERAGTATGRRLGEPVGRGIGAVEDAGLATGRRLGEPVGRGITRVEETAFGVGQRVGEPLGRGVERIEDAGYRTGFAAGVRTGEAIDRAADPFGRAAAGVADVGQRVTGPPAAALGRARTAGAATAAAPFQGLGRAGEAALSARPGTGPLEPALQTAEKFGETAGQRLGRFVAREERRADLRTDEPDELLLRSESQPLEGDFEAGVGEFELPGLFQSPDLSGLRLTAGGGMSQGIELRLPRLFGGRQQVTAFAGQEIAGMPDEAAGFGFAVRGRFGNLVERDVTAAAGRAIAEDIGGQRVPDPGTSGFRFLTEEAEAGTTYVRPPGSRSPELETVSPPGTLFREIDDFAVRGTGGGRIPGRAFEFVGRGDPEDVARMAEEVDDLVGAGEVARRLSESRRVSETAPLYPPVGTFGATSATGARETDVSAPSAESVASPFGTATTAPTVSEPLGTTTAAASPTESFRLTEPVDAGTEPVSEPTEPVSPTSGPVSTTSPFGPTEPTSIGGESGVPSTGIPTAGVPTTGIPTTGTPTTGIPTTGTPTIGTPTTGTPTTPPPPTFPGLPTPPTNQPLFPDRTDEDEPTFWEEPPEGQEFQNPVATGAEFLFGNELSESDDLANPARVFTG